MTMLNNTSDLLIRHTSPQNQVTPLLEEVGLIPIIMSDIMEKLLLLVMRQAERKDIADKIVHKVRIPRHLMCRE